MTSASRQYHPMLQQTNLTIDCNVTADPAPDVNWKRGRTVLSKYDSKVNTDNSADYTYYDTLLHSLHLKNKYEMMTLKRNNESLPGTADEAVTRQFILIIKDIREEDYGTVIINHK